MPIIWRRPAGGNAVPQFCLGATNGRQWKDYFWISADEFARPAEEASWVEIGDGWSVSMQGDFVPAEYSRSTAANWSLAVNVVDGRGWVWVLPVILSGEGQPLICQRWLLDETGWRTEGVTPEVERAVQACTRIRADHSPMDRLAAIVAVLEASYHLDHKTVGVLGLVDSVLLCNGLNAVCNGGEENRVTSD